MAIAAQCKPAWSDRAPSSAALFAGLLLIVFAVIIAKFPLRNPPAIALAIRAAIVAFELLLGGALVYGLRIARPVGAGWALIMLLFFVALEGGALPFAVYFLAVFLLLAVPPATASTVFFVLLALPLFLQRLFLTLEGAQRDGDWDAFWRIFLSGRG